MKRLGMHSWQKDGPHADLPAFVPADEAPPLDPSPASFAPSTAGNEGKDCGSR